MTEILTGRLDPLGDSDALRETGTKKNFARVGSARPSSLLYTYGPGSVMDLPRFTVMPGGFDEWERIWGRRDGAPTISAPRLLNAVRVQLGYQLGELRPFPREAKKNFFSNEGNDLGVPAWVFPQWLRCTGCDLLGPLAKFEYSNEHPYRTDEAGFDHAQCPGRPGKGKRTRRPRPCVPARYLLVCVNGHVDEFPYDLWVHRGQPCPKADVPRLRMVEGGLGKGASSTIVCESCDRRRPMSEAQGAAGRDKLPPCRGRHPHLDAFAPCDKETRLMLIGASNLWFPATQSIIVMPSTGTDRIQELGDRLRDKLGAKVEKYRNDLDTLRDVAEGKVDGIESVSDVDLAAAVAHALEPLPTEEARKEAQAAWDPIQLLVPEWQYLQRDPLGRRQDDPSGLVLTTRARHDDLPDQIDRVLAIDRLRKVNALLGFTRVDELDRINDLPNRLAPLTRDGKPKWTVATQDNGEGIFIQLDEKRVAEWEEVVLGHDGWEAHRAAHERNFHNRFSETAENVAPESRLRPPRYWLVHTFAHVLIREMAMYCGYSAASLSERLYAWQGADGREPAAGLIICTTASDSDGTLGGLVQLSEPERLAHLVQRALERAHRCSSDPVCATRSPRDPEDFLHGAACHCCAMASETSCERANRFLDRRFLVNLPGSTLGFFE